MDINEQIRIMQAYRDGAVLEAYNKSNPLEDAKAYIDEALEVSE